MTTYLWLYDAAGITNQLPAYSAPDVKLTTATRSLLEFSGSVTAGVFTGESVRESYHGRFNLTGNTPAGRVNSVEVVIGGEAVLGARYDDPVRVRAYNGDFADRMDGDVSFRGNAWANWYESGAGDDRLVGGGGNDSFDGGAGDDVLFGGAGQDDLKGGAGSDTLVGGAGNDFYLVDGDDRLTEAANGGRDTVAATVSFRLPENFEMLTLVADAVTGWGNGTRNWMAGNGEANVLYGLAGGDALAGFAGADTLVGGLGDDSILGGFGRDRLIGGAGKDVLEGGAHGDWLIGGGGADIFSFARPSDSGPTLRDTITDFGPNDVIDLGRMDAQTNHSGNDAFRYIGSQGFHETAGELRYARGLLSGDVDGDGVADFVIRLLGAPTLTADDFVL